MDSELASWERTLSPSDFGFHNCLKGAHGRLTFLDFEYFGWDDPAKMVSDFLLHPAMDLDLPLKKRFLTGILQGLSQDESLADRIETVYPLFGLKWCLIFLNRFLPEKQYSWKPVGSDALGQEKLLEEQLAKARCMVNRILQEYEQFPYYD